MCLLILLRDADPDFPLILAGNRDERRDRKAAPPGLFVGAYRRMLSPRDRQAEGTWLAVGDQGMVAGLTNFAPGRDVETTTSRGELPHLALDQDDIESAVRAVHRRCAEAPFRPFQLLLADQDRAIVIVNDGASRARFVVPDQCIVMTNEHRVGELAIPDAAGLLEPGLDLDARVERLQHVLRDTGERSGHPINKKGGDYGTVSSSVVCVPASDLLQLRWYFAVGEPDEAPFKNYGNLAKRIV